MTTSEVFQQTLERLDGNLTVSLVATQHPMMFHVDDDLDDTLAIMRLNDFSQAPVVDGTAVVGVVEDSRINSGGLVGRVTVPLSGRMLLSERAGLRSTIRLLSTSEFGYRLVVGGKGIEALVTRSDLQKLPVRLLVFTYITRLESLIAESILRKCSDEKWLNLLSGRPDGFDEDARRAIGTHVGEAAVRKLNRAQEGYRAAGIAPSPMELTQFPQKWYVAYRAFDLDIGFVEDMVSIQRFLRNVVMHSKNFAQDDAELRGLEHRLVTTEYWIDHFSI